MDEYNLYLAGECGLLILSPEMVEFLIDRIYLSDTKALHIPGEELISREYEDYLVGVIRANRQYRPVWKEAQKVYGLAAGQIRMLRVNQLRCFQRVRVRRGKEGWVFLLYTNEVFFRLVQQRGSCFRYMERK